MSVRDQVCAVALAIGLVACGQPAAPKPGEPGGYDVSAADLQRPCSLLTEAEAAAVAQAPFRAPMAQDRRLGPQTTCSYQVGAASAPGLVQVTVAHGDEGVSARELFALRCGETSAKSCTMPSGLLVLRAGSVTLEVSVQDGAGAVDPAKTKALGDLLAPRIAALQSAPPSATSPR